MEESRSNDGYNFQKCESILNSCIVPPGTYRRIRTDKHGSFRVRSTNFLLNLRDPTPISMKFGTLGDYA